MKHGRTRGVFEIAVAIMKISWLWTYFNDAKNYQKLCNSKSRNEQNIINPAIWLLGMKCGLMTPSFFLDFNKKYSLRRHKSL